MTDRVGQQLDNYGLIRLLGAGSFGEVYLAEHIYHKTQVAIKILPQLAQDDLRGFLTEARTFRLKHPNIVHVLDFGVEGRIPFIVMEYAPNGTLRQRHPKGSRVPFPTIVSYVKQVASALQYAHNERLVHRDVKPENMLIGGQNQVLLSDFGIATIAHSTALQSVETMAGTIPYMAPEQIQGHPRPASDQYSLGVIVYEWLCGERPFHGTLTEVAVKHVMVHPPPLRERVPTIPPEIEQVVLTALAKDPRQRFGSVQAFAAAFEQASRAGQLHPLTFAQVIPAVSQPQQMNIAVPRDTSAQTRGLAPTPGQSLQPISPPSPRRPEPARHGISRRTMVQGLGIAGLAVAGGGIGWFVVSRSSPQPSASTPTPTPRSLSTALFTYKGHSNHVHAVAWSPDGRRIASGSDDDTVQVWDASTGRNALIYRGHSSEVHAVAWSPNGTRIASGGAYDNTVQVWNAADGRHVYTYRGYSGYAVAWSPDSRRIASTGSDNTVQVWDASTGTNVLTYMGHSSGVTAVAWSPDGKRIASGSYDDTVQVWDASTGTNVLTYTRHRYFVRAVAWSLDGRRIASGSGSDRPENYDDTVQVWDASTGAKLFTYTGHSVYVAAVAWSLDGRRIASGGGDKTVQVWDATTGGYVFTYTGHSDAVIAVAWSPDGTRIASGSDDQTVQVWGAG